MKFLSYLSCTINTVLVVLTAFSIIRAEKYYVIWIIPILALMVAYTWYSNFRTYKILDKYKK